MNENTMTREQLIGEINAMKILLKDSDYVALKVSEALMNGDDTEPYAEKIAARKEWRAKLNEYERLLEEMPEPEPEIEDEEPPEEIEEPGVIEVDEDETDGEEQEIDITVEDTGGEEVIDITDAEEEAANDTDAEE